MMQRMMMIAALCGALAAPAAMQAQMGTPTGAMAAPADILNKQLAGQEKEFVDAADAMPEDKYNYAPTSGEFKGVRTFSDQVKHVAASHYYYFGKWGLPNTKANGDIMKLTSKAEIMQALRDSFAYEHAAFATITPANAFVEVGPRNDTRMGTAVGALAHMMDHYGQMVEYLRMNGIVPPASRK